MKKYFILGLLACVVLCVAVLSATKPKNLTKYAPESKLYTISLPETEGGWTVAEGSNANSVVVDNSDRSFTVMVQAFTEENGTVMFSDLDEMENFYYESMIQNFGETDAKSVKIGKPAMKDVRTHNYLVEQDGVVVGAEVNVFKTEKALYALTISGVGDAYDKNIDAVNAALKTFKEK